MSKYAHEHVLVITRSLFDTLGSFQGLSTEEPQRYLDAILEDGNNFYLSRDDAEEDPSHKQIIPYSIFCHGGKVLSYVRGGSSGEKRLASQASIGIGGHINTDDSGAAGGLGPETYALGLDREVEEELVLSGSYSQRIVALLNDDSNPVGSVHLGVVHRFDLTDADVTPGEDAICELAFLSPDELRADRDRYETWSKFLIDVIEDLVEM